MSIISQEQKIIDLENEISFLKDRLYEEQEQNEYLRDKVDKQQKEIEEKSTIIMAGAEKVKQLEKEIEEYQKCFEDIERHQKNQMQMQKELWKRLKGELNE